MKLQDQILERKPREKNFFKSQKKAYKMLKKIKKIFRKGNQPKDRPHHQ